MWQVVRTCVALLLLIQASSHVSGYIADYSDSTWPYMALRVAHLEIQRKELLYGDTVVPRSQGLIELECNVASSSLAPALGLELEDEVAGIEWDLPNPNMLEEKRAFIKEQGTQEVKLQSFLVITDFNEAEDAGAYSCRLAFKHEYITRYRQQIFIPTLDGAPILKCELECQRNTDEACQLLGEYTIKCQTYSKSKAHMSCRFQECETEDACLPTFINPTITKTPGDFFNRPTSMFNHKSEQVTGGLATRSGAFSCEATSDEGISGLRLYMPVTFNRVKEPGLIQAPVPSDKVPPPLPFMQEDASGKYSYWKKDWYGTEKSYEFGCWTSKDSGPFQWSFRSIAHREWSQNLTENTLPYIDFMNFNSNGGHGSVLRLRDATIEHGGFYFCEATDGNNNLMSHRQFQLSAAVWKDDANVNKDLTITRQVGSSVTLRCTMRTTDSHIVTWEKHYEDGSAGNIGPEPNIELSHDYEILTIHNLTKRDSGLYKCQDSFDVASLNGKVTLNVVDQPFDQYEQIENLQHALKALREAEEEVSDIVRGFVPQPQGRGVRDEDDDDSSEEEED